jgi:hypothetical protein
MTSPPAVSMVVLVGIVALAGPRWDAAGATVAAVAS